MLTFDDLVLHYQPQVLAARGDVVAVEALLRPRNMSTSVSAETLIKQLSENGLIVGLDEWVFRRACREAALWPDIIVSVNLSANRFLEADLPDRLVSIASEAGISTGRIEIEIVESAYIQDFDRAFRILNGLREVGFKIAIDDFGTGYSSLSYLLKLPVDKVKIDKCFIEDVSSMRSAAIVQAIVALSRALGLKVTVEGVETEEQWRFIRTAGCHYAQGWFFHKAMPPEDITKLLDREPKSPPAKALTITR